MTRSSTLRRTDTTVNPPSRRLLLPASALALALLIAPPLHAGNETVVIDPTVDPLEAVIGHIGGAGMDDDLLFVVVAANPMGARNALIAYEIDGGIHGPVTKTILTTNTNTIYSLSREVVFHDGEYFFAYVDDLQGWVGRYDPTQPQGSRFSLSQATANDLVCGTVDLVGAETRGAAISVPGPRSDPIVDKRPILACTQSSAGDLSIHELPAVGRGVWELAALVPKEGVIIDAGLGGDRPAVAAEVLRDGALAIYGGYTRQDVPDPDAPLIRSVFYEGVVLDVDVLPAAGFDPANAGESDFAMLLDRFVYSAIDYGDDDRDTNRIANYVFDGNGNFSKSFPCSDVGGPILRDRPFFFAPFVEESPDPTPQDEFDYTSNWCQDTISEGRWTFNIGFRFKDDDSVASSTYDGPTGKVLAWEALSPRMGFTYALSENAQLAVGTALPEHDPADPRVVGLYNDQFLFETYWSDFAGSLGASMRVPFGSNDSGLTYFFDEDNWEQLGKIVDACKRQGRFWVFAASTTNVEYTTRVTDTNTGYFKEYFNPLGNPSEAITDTDGLTVCPGSKSRAARSASVHLDRLDDYREVVRGYLSAEASTEPAALLDVAPPSGNHFGELSSATELVPDSTFGPRMTTCQPGTANLCLNQGRFKVEVEWRDFNSNTGSGKVVPFGSDDSGLFYFFAADNWEMLVKVLRGCGFNNHYWVFAAATTDVEYTLRVTDTETDEEREYFNPLGRAAPAITDIEAFESCP